ncbi:nitrate reductase cytochrome c-type subunit; periplasmic nitrate reductase electron transfer subunit [Caminibacter mediatlanticus TB-2]|uniref:Periplasmic nitrate reductase, electron transfer subunit n=1 Tax=Caminibacter mediatlanticus TB-2 TaxID=391592 RepID=A0ABX5VCI5_9BACT|nr:nitrate reductase cytochrome c-type subunit [Caminibacter mediatlanticus]QCT94361.1 nitrate reductase cytochrome c-type subunit; periplasmic nitrate reductase electron transfer subunit [Caminibacter mediatlanticus TB-2]
MKKLLISTIALAGFLFAGCQQTMQTQKKDVEITGVRKAPLTEGSQNLPIVKYNDQAPIPGKVKPFKKSFVTAPPMIPHSVEGMVPITKNNNMCLNCHMPQNAKALGVIPMPRDHFVDNFENGKVVHKVAGSRYFCTLCHTPQAKLDPVIENKFESLKNK